MARWRRIGLAALLGLALGAVPARTDEAAVKAQVAKLRASDPNAWQRIPWTAALRDAEKASQSEKRALLLFSYEGNLETGRC